MLRCCIICGIDVTLACILSLRVILKMPCWPMYIMSWSSCADDPGSFKGPGLSRLPSHPHTLFLEMLEVPWPLVGRSPSLAVLASLPVYEDVAMSLVAVLGLSLLVWRMDGLAQTVGSSQCRPPHVWASVIDLSVRLYSLPLEFSEEVPSPEYRAK